MRNLRSRASGHGSARDGTHHWWMQRLTAIALVPLGVLFLFPFARVAAGAHPAAIELYARPWHALVAVLFLGVSAYHLCLGMRVVIEDYVHHGGVRTALLIANALGCTALAAAGILAVIGLGLA